MSEAIRRESAPELLWKPDNIGENMDSANPMKMPSNEHCFQNSEDATDVNGNYTDKFSDGNEQFCMEDKESLNRFVNSGHFHGNDGATCQGQCDDNCNNCDCKSSADAAANQRRNSASDLNFQASDIFTNSNSNANALRRTSVLGSTGKSMEKMDKINLANLVFNPNFKNSAGCVNLPVIRAGQNLAQKNAQRSSLSSARDVASEGSVLPPKDINQMTKQAALDLLARQLQPQSLDQLAQKLQQLSIQQKSKASGSADASHKSTILSAGLGSSDEIIQTFTGNPQQSQPPQGNALRYKTELCRSHEEGGECRFGSACTFAHGAEELRPVPRHPLYKTELCRTYHQHGYCQYGTRCHFIHDADDADKNAPLKGCKSWGRHDQLSGAMLSLASSSGLLDSTSAAKKSASSSDNDALLANLRRLYALRVMNGQETATSTAAAPTGNSNNQFSMSQPLGQQLAMARQQLASAGQSASQNLPLSMTQPLPMDSLHAGMQRAGQAHPYHQRAAGQHYPHMSSNRLESLANEYAGWNGAPTPSPTYSGVSPFGSYHQQFSPLPRHQPTSSGYPTHPYSFSATAPDLSASLNMISPYSMSPQSFSNTANVGHYLQDPNANYAAAAAAAASANYHKNAASATTNTQAASGANVQNPYVGAPNPVWPQTSAEVSSAIDNELFGFGLDSQHNSGNSSAGNKSGSASGYPLPSHQQYQHPYFQSIAAYQQQMAHQQAHGASQAAYAEQAKYAYQNAAPAHTERTEDTDLLNLLQRGHSDKYANGHESRTMSAINESDDCHDLAAKPKNRIRTSLSNVKFS